MALIGRLHSLGPSDGTPSNIAKSLGRPYRARWPFVFHSRAVGHLLVPRNITGTDRASIVPRPTVGYKMKTSWIGSLQR